MLSGVTNEAITGAGPEGGDVVPEPELWPPLLAGVVAAGTVATVVVLEPLVVVVLGAALLELLEQPLAKAATPSAHPTTAISRVDLLCGVEAFPRESIGAVLSVTILFVLCIDGNG